jgi:hypothetical protein
VKPTANAIGPWDFPPGTPAWTAAMLQLEERRKSPEVHMHITNDGEECKCERCKRGIPQGPNDITVQIIQVGGEAPCASEKEVREPRRATSIRASESGHLTQSMSKAAREWY